MSWNYRIVHTHGNKPENWDFYGVHEVYYYKNGKPKTMTEKSISPVGEDVKEFIRSWVLYQTAFQKPILVYDCDSHKFTGEVQITAIEKEEDKPINQGKVLASIRKRRFSPPENSPESIDLLREDRQR